MLKESTGDHHYYALHDYSHVPLPLSADHSISSGSTWIVVLQNFEWLKCGVSSKAETWYIPSVLQWILWKQQKIGQKSFTTWYYHKNHHCSSTMQESGESRRVHIYITEFTPLNISSAVLAASRTLIITVRLLVLDRDVSKIHQFREWRRTSSLSCVSPSVFTVVSLKIWILNSSGPVVVTLWAVLVGKVPLPLRQYDDKSSVLVPRDVTWLERNILLLKTTKRVLVYLECGFS